MADGKHCRFGEAIIEIKASLVSSALSLNWLHFKSQTMKVWQDVFHADTAITALRNGGEVLSDGLLVAVVWKGQPEFKRLRSMSHTEMRLSFVGFKTNLRRFEDTEKMRTATGDNAMNARLEQRGRHVSLGDWSWECNGGSGVLQVRRNLARSCGAAPAGALHTWTPPPDGRSAEDETTHAKPVARQTTRMKSLPGEVLQIR